MIFYITEKKQYSQQKIKSSAKKKLLFPEEKQLCIVMNRFVNNS